MAFLAVVTAIIGRASLNGASTPEMCVEIAFGLQLACVLEFVWIVFIRWLLSPNR